MRKRYLTVPKNKKGIEEYDQGIENTSNLIENTISDEEFEKLMSAGVFGYINTTCNLLIDDYESEIVYADDLKKCMEFIKEYQGTFLIAARQAITYDSFLALDF